MTAGHKWMPLQRATALPYHRDVINATMAHYGVSEQRARAMLEADRQCAEIWLNDLYQVEVRRDEQNAAVWLNIRRVDGYPGREWRHFQQIKNELVGPECEAVELYPAESRLVDTSNKYHLWCCTDPTFRFPFGYENRDVRFDNETHPGLRQCPPMQIRGDGRAKKIA